MNQVRTIILLTILFPGILYSKDTKFQLTNFQIPLPKENIQSNYLLAQSTDKETFTDKIKIRSPNFKRYEYVPYIRYHHSAFEIAGDLTMIYGIAWGMYVATQYYRIDSMSFDSMGTNMGKIRVWDGDQVLWNFIIHPLSGSQLYLYYRGRAYSPFYSFALTFTSSALFEFFIETATESPSLNDLIITPVIGSSIGVFLEQIAIRLLNSDQQWQHILGRIIHPSSNFYWFENKINPVTSTYEIIPTIGYRVSY